MLRSTHVTFVVSVAVCNTWVVVVLPLYSKSDLFALNLERIHLPVNIPYHLTVLALPIIVYKAH